VAGDRAVDSCACAAVSVSGSEAFFGAGVFGGDLDGVALGDPVGRAAQGCGDAVGSDVLASV